MNRYWANCSCRWVAFYVIALGVISVLSLTLVYIFSSYRYLNELHKAEVQDVLYLSGQNMPDQFPLLDADGYAAVASVRSITGVLACSVILIVVLGVIVIVRSAVIRAKEIDAIKSSLNNIMLGNFGQRLDTNSDWSDYRRLSVHINSLLDSVEVLVEGVRHSADTIAHDLRTPLTRLRNNMSNLHVQAEGALQGNINLLIDEVDAVLSIFNSLLRIAQIDVKDRRSKFAQLDLKMLMQDVLDLYDPLAAQKHIIVRQYFCQDALLCGDKDLLFQALVNVLDNAIKYTSRNGGVDITLNVEDDAALVSISDNGIGIADLNKVSVFRQFFRVNAIGDEQAGSGLGLSLVLAVVKLHNGTINLLDNHPGLRVEIKLPL